jgi:3-hydroxybutyryl-CoA dehydrogenase
MAAKPSIAVVGAGLMGHGIAQVFAEAGHAVTLHDPFPEALAAAPARVRGNLTQLGRAPDAADRIALHPELPSAVEEAAWVFEAIPEKLELKQDLMARLGRAAPPEALFATNTSVISITEIAEGADDPGRVVGTHWWNPPFLVPLVEVVPGDRTRPDAVEQTLKLLTAAGKSAVRVARDVPGFIGNRLQHALWREAFAIVDAGLCDAETIDRVIKDSFGRRLPVLGPMETADLVGLDLTLDIHSYLLPRLDPPSEPSQGLIERVGRGELGMKTGRGFREWAPGEREALNARVQRHLVAMAAEPSPETDRRPEASTTPSSP